MEKFKLEKQDADNFKIIGIAEEYCVCGYTLICRNGDFYIQSPKNVEVNRGFKIGKKHLFKTIYNWFEEPDSKEMKANWQKMMPSSIKSALEINHEAMQQLHIDCFWGMKKIKSI